MSVGVIYVAVGKNYIEEACFSAFSLKDKMPELSVTIFSNEAVQAKCFDECKIIEASGSGYVDKITGMSSSPYDYTLFLDTDTYIVSDFWELFSLLEKYDIGASLGEHRVGINRLGERYDYQKMKDNNGRFIYPIYNSGVILYKKNHIVRQFFADWFILAKQDMQEKGNNYGDQPSFQQALHYSNLREVILSPEYNCRFGFPICVSGTVKILHGRAPDITKIAKEINSVTDTRLFHPQWGLIGNGLSLLNKVLTRSNYSFIKKIVKTPDR